MVIGEDVAPVMGLSVSFVAVAAEIVSGSMIVKYTSVCVNFMPERVLNIVCFVALRPKSTAMVIAGRSVHLTTLFPGQA